VHPGALAAAERQVPGKLPRDHRPLGAGVDDEAIGPAPIDGDRNRHPGRAVLEKVEDFPLFHRRGPYRFVVDTGAERTVIARELARDLSLGRGQSARVHSMSEVSTIDTAIIGKLDVGGNSVRGIHAPTLARTYLGAEGMLGVDSLKSQRVSFDFAKQEMTVAPSRKREERWADGAIVVTGRSRFGHLVLVDASVEGQKVWVIVDTGSEVTIGNNALRRKLAAKNKLGALSPINIISVTGGRLVADQGVMKRIRLGGMDINSMPIAFADVHPFKKLDLIDRPAILLGMDTLRLFERVSVDFAARKVRMLAPPQSGLKGRIMLAAGQRGRLGS
jgi:predicted aspartyl protease